MRVYWQPSLSLPYLGLVSEEITLRVERSAAQAPPSAWLSLEPLAWPFRPLTSTSLDSQDQCPTPTHHRLQVRNLRKHSTSLTQ